MIKILKPLKPNKQPKNKYKFVIELMGGDGDAYFHPEVLVDKDNPYLDRFLKFLDNCKKKYPHGKGGDDNYNDVEDYWLFVECDEYPEEIEENGVWRETTQEDWDSFDSELNNCGIQFEWENSYEYFGESSYRNVTVSYFDENGIEYECKIIENE